MSADDKLYKNQLEDNLAFYDLYLDDYMKRLEFCRENGCNTVMLTGNAEPQQNKRFLADFGIMMRLMDRPFPIVEMQTTGVGLDDKYLRFLRNHVGVSTISVSLFSFSDDEDWEARGGSVNERTVRRNIRALCENVKRYDFNLRLSLNLTKDFERFAPTDLFKKCKDLGADQVTLRQLYDADDGSPQSAWVKENGAGRGFIDGLNAIIKTYGKVLRRLEYGFTVYSIDGMSTVLDSDCMSKDTDREELKYLIVRPNGKLYSQWDDPASLIF
jgi:sulfatase maturation enzyme AslB (radical SAM superfamily)